MRNNEMNRFFFSFLFFWKGLDWCVCVLMKRGGERGNMGEKEMNG